MEKVNKAFSTNGTGKLNIHTHRKEVGPLANTIYKNYLKIDQGPKCKTVKQ